jgi:urease accessory protein UreE
VNLLPTTVLVVTPDDRRRGLAIALELGNLHVPVQVTDDAIVLLPDGPGEGVLKRYGERYREELRRFAPLRVTVLQSPIVSAEFTTIRTG